MSDIKKIKDEFLLKLEENLNLNQIKSLINTFDIPIGFSDHTESTSLPAVAVTLGAKMIEKHFTYNRNVQGFDHFYSLEPKELKEMMIEYEEYKKVTFKLSPEETLRHTDGIEECVEKIANTAVDITNTFPKYV